MATSTTSPVKTQTRTIDGLSILYAESAPREVSAILLSRWPESFYTFEQMWPRLGASAALDELNKITGDVRLAEYQPYWAARAELLAKAGAHNEARHAYEIAIGLEQRDDAVRRFLQRRQSALGS